MHRMLLTAAALAGCGSKPAPAPPANTAEIGTATAELAPVELAKFHTETIGGRAVTVIDAVTDSDLPEPPLAEIHGLVNARLGELRACYVDLLTRVPDAMGVVNLHLRIDPVGAPAILSVHGLDGIDACMKSTVASWPKFPPATRDRGYDLYIAFTPR